MQPMHIVQFLTIIAKRLTSFENIVEYTLLKLQETYLLCEFIKTYVSEVSTLVPKIYFTKQKYQIIFTNGHSFI